eukprot:1191812-Prorocentrum_minimum.AAC.3
MHAIGFTHARENTHASGRCRLVRITRSTRFVKDRDSLQKLMRMHSLITMCPRLFVYPFFVHKLRLRTSFGKLKPLFVFHNRLERARQGASWGRVVRCECVYNMAPSSAHSWQNPFNRKFDVPCSWCNYRFLVTLDNRFLMRLPVGLALPKSRLLGVR